MTTSANDSAGKFPLVLLNALIAMRVTMTIPQYANTGHLQISNKTIEKFGLLKRNLQLFGFIFLTYGIENKGT